jgi:hypothetical protein
VTHYRAHQGRQMGGATAWHPGWRCQIWSRY